MFSISPLLTKQLLSLKNNVSNPNNLIGNPFLKHQVPLARHPNLKFENLAIVTWGYDKEKIIDMYKSIAPDFYFMGIILLDRFHRIYGIEPKINFKQVIFPMFLNSIIILDLNIQPHEIIFIQKSLDKPDYDLNDVYKTIMSFLKMVPIEKSNKVWFDVYWQFLFTTSLLSNDNKQACDAFALSMQNIAYILLCNSCSMHYIRNKPYVNVTAPILCSKDPTTVLFNLKNMINLQKGAPVQNITILDTLYGAKPIKIYRSTVLIDSNQNVQYVDVKN